MFTTVDEVKELTGYEVTLEQIGRAQGIIEVYTGHNEFEVSEAGDVELMAKAVGYQSAYMKDDPLRVFEQMSVAQLSQFGASVSFKNGDTVSPWVSPLAVMACNKLSWKRMRSVRVAPIFGRDDYSEWRWDRA